MTAPRDRVEELFHAARREPAARRRAFLQTGCDGDSTLQAEVEALLAASERVRDFLQPPGRIDAALAADLMTAALAGQRLGRYRIRRVIGRGGMGVVYEAEQDNPRRIVALKVIHPGMASAAMLRRFEHESELLGRLQHPGIAQIYEAGTADAGFGPQQFFAMELVDGQPLAQYAEARRLSVGERLRLLAKVCDAVQHAHLRGVIHRDLKPANILVGPSGQPKVLDFGIARATDRDPAAPGTLSTSAGQLVGTVPYMSPEQITGEPADVDTRADVYALGVIGYEMLSGRLPYDLAHRSLPEIVRMIGERDPRPLGAVSRTLAGDIETLVSKAMHREKRGRYQSSADFAADIERFLRDEPILARPPSTTYQLRKLIVRHKLPFACAAALITALVGFAVIMAVQSKKLAVERDKALGAEQLAAHRLQAMEWARHEAESEADKAARVTAFLQEVLASAYPSREGRGMIVREMLDRAARRLDRELLDHPEVAAAVHTALGRSNASLSEYELAERHLEKALQLNVARFGRDHVDVARSLFELASLRMETGDLDRAEPRLREVLALQRGLPGDNREDILMTLSDLSRLLHSKGAHREAEPLIVEALSLYRVLVAEGRSLVGVDLTAMAAYLCMESDCPAGQALFEDALERHRLVLGEDHEVVANDMEALAGMLGWLAQWDRAEALLEGALRIRLQALGDSHPQIAASFRNVAQLREWKGEHAGAESMYRQALQLWRQLLGDEYMDAAETLYHLAGLLARRSDSTAAIALYRETMRLDCRLLGDDHWDVAMCAGRLGKLLQERGDDAEAAALLQGALVILRRVLPEDHWRVCSTQALLGRCLVSQDRFDEARVLLRAGLAGLQAEAGPPRPETGEAQQWLSTLDKAWDDHRRR